MLSFLIIDYLNGMTDIKVFNNDFNAKRYYNKLLKTKFKEISKHNIIQANSLLIRQNGDIVRGF